MKKSFLLLPLATLVLTACGSSTPAPVVSADGSDLSPGVMQPVVGTGATDSGMGWQSDVQNTSMPDSMSNSTYSQPTYSQPSYGSASTTTAPQASAPSQPVATEVQSQPQPSTKTVTQTSTKKVKKAPTASKDFSIPRDENNKPIYSQINKGFYDHETYTVRTGDTMYLIAYIVGKDVKEIAAMNNMSEPYQLVVGRKLKVNDPRYEEVTVTTTKEVPVEPEVTYTPAANGTAYGSDGSITGPVKAGTGEASAQRPTVTASAGTSAPRVTATTGTVASRSSSTTAAPASSIKWQWPTQGRVIQGFSSSEGGNKGLDIAGTKGQDVKAAAAGRVVYAGNALQGYGNLIIIKHNDDFLSAYAHNDKIKVSEQATVKAGQAIATLGSTGTNTNKLHFEIRYRGKSVDPSRYLPAR